MQGYVLLAKLESPTGRDSHNAIGPSGGQIREAMVPIIFSLWALKREYVAFATTTNSYIQAVYESLIMVVIYW